MDVIPRHVICILGHWQNLDEVAEVVARVGGPGFELDRLSTPRSIASGRP
jgi:hypothetical protein